MKNLKRLILKYNAVVGKDHLPEIRELTSRLSLEIESVLEESAVSGKKIKVISVRGEQRCLQELDRALVRYPAIAIRKAA